MNVSLPETGLRELHLFAGGGGGILGGMLLGHRTVCAVEIEPYRRKILLQRQRDGILPWFPIWDDIKTFDGKPWRGIADVVCGGFPCRGISNAGKMDGFDNPETALWSEQFRVVCEVGPKGVFVENTPNLTFLGLERVLFDLASVGYDARWCVLGGGDIGQDCDGRRIWILAKAASARWEEFLHRDDGFNQEKICNEGAPASPNPPSLIDRIRKHESRCGESALLGECNGMAHIVDRLGAVGDGQIPELAKVAWQTLATT